MNIQELAQSKDQVKVNDLLREALFNMQYNPETGENSEYIGNSIDLRVTIDILREIVARTPKVNRGTSSYLSLSVNDVNFLQDVVDIAQNS